MDIRLRLPDVFFVKDPESSALGRRMVQMGVCLIEAVGFEQFTFRKLAAEINSTEASAYRYFENKHQFLLYILNLYWNWLEYQLILHTANIPSAQTRLRVAIRVLCAPESLPPEWLSHDVATLQRVVVCEASKAYLTKEVDAINREGAFLSYKRLCRRVADIVRELSPSYPYPAALVSTLAEAAHHQAHFAAHLPSLTELQPRQAGAIVEFATDLAFSALRLPHGQAALNG